MSLIFEHDAGPGDAHALWIAGQSTASADDFLRRNQIRTRISLTGKKASGQLPHAGVYDGYQMLDRKDPRIWRSVVNMIWASLQCGSVLLYCNQGKTRSPSVAAFSIMVFCSMSVRDAVKHVEQCRATVDIHENCVTAMEQLGPKMPRRDRGDVSPKPWTVTRQAFAEETADLFRVFAEQDYAAPAEESEEEAQGSKSLHVLVLIQRPLARSFMSP